MKITRIILLFAIIAFTAQSIYAQVSKEPFKKSNTILVETQLTNDEAFASWGRHLASEGYTIDQSNNTFYSITTGPKDTSKFNCDFIVSSTVIDGGTIMIKLKWRIKSSLLVGTQATDFDDWEYMKGKNNICNVIYRDLIATVESFGPYNVTYQKK